MNLLLLILYRATSRFLHKLRAMSEARSRRGFELGEWVMRFAYLGVSLYGTKVVMGWIYKSMDPNGYEQAKKQTAKKAKQVEQRLGFLLGNDVTAHELMAVDMVVEPDGIETTVDDIGGLDNILERLVSQVEGPLLHRDIFNGGLLKHPKGILLYGPPGTGKTMMAQAIAKQCHAFFIAVQPSALQSKWYGETNKHVSGVFKLARRLAQNAACVIFIDEVDALFSKRQAHEHEVSLSMKTEFMSLWDGMDTDPNSKIVVMGATNRPQELDPAVLRRFTVSIEVNLPGKEAREDILRTVIAKHCREHGLGDQAVDKNLRENCEQSSLGGKRPLQWVAEQTSRYSGADLHELATEAARHSVRQTTAVLSSLRGRRQPAEQQQQQAAQQQPPLTLSDFEAALEYYRPTAVQAEQFQGQQPAIDPMAAMASFMHQVAQHNDEIPAYTPPGNNGDAGSSQGADNQDGAESI